VTTAGGDAVLMDLDGVLHETFVRARKDMEQIVDDVKPHGPDARVVVCHDAELRPPPEERTAARAWRLPADVEDVDAVVHAQPADGVEVGPEVQPVAVCPLLQHGHRDRWSPEIVEVRHRSRRLVVLE
jgi:hypothetical protein